MTLKPEHFISSSLGSILLATAISQGKTSVNEGFVTRIAKQNGRWPVNRNYKRRLVTYLNKQLKKTP